MGETLSAQISRDIRDSINTLPESISLRDWMTSGYTPSDVFSNVKSFNSSAANSALCEVLSALTDSELSLFQDALKEDVINSQPANALPCTASLINRIQNHWQTLLAAQNPMPNQGDSIETEIRKIPAGETEIDQTELNSGEFALVFEGPLDSPQSIQTLKQLQQFNVQAVFLVPGNSARNHVSIVKALAQAGEALGSQSTDEEDMTLLPTEEANKKLQEGAQNVSHILGHRTKFFSFPLSEEDVELSPLQDFTRSQGMIQVLPSLDSEDWKTLDPKVLAQNVSTLTAKSSKGIILLHSRLEQTALALPQILKNLSRQHRKLVIFRQ